ncbi:MAG: hypothetical protein OYH77_05425 [Pseudomonadota bacterium]|nr:hypothetical protein [Pseudomonadota bacterium]
MYKSNSLNLFTAVYLAKALRLLLVGVVSTGLSVALVAGKARAEVVVDPHKMHDLIVIAGYSTAIGAAVGAAMLAFTDKPGKHISYLYRGAAIGFLGGALVGSYVVFSPLLMPEPNYSSTDMSERLNYVPDPQLLGAKLVISPVLSGLELREVAAKFTLAQF